MKLEIYVTMYQKLCIDIAKINEIGGKKQNKKYFVLLLFIFLFLSEIKLVIFKFVYIYILYTFIIFHSFN